MTRDDLAAAGRLLHGADWQQPLGRALGVAPRTIQRWAAGETSPTPGVAGELAVMLEARAIAVVALPGECRALAARLRSGQTTTPPRSDREMKP